MINYLRNQNLIISKKTCKKNIKNVKKLVLCGINPRLAFEMCGFTEQELGAISASMIKRDILHKKAVSNLNENFYMLDNPNVTDDNVTVTVKVGEDGAIDQTVSYDSLISECVELENTKCPD